jgi:hypothetical protein
VLCDAASDLLHVGGERGGVEDPELGSDVEGGLVADARVVVLGGEDHLALGAGRLALRAAPRPRAGERKGGEYEQAEAGAAA